MITRRALRVAALGALITVLAGCDAAAVRNDILHQAPAIKAKVDAGDVPASSARIASPANIYIPVTRIKTLQQDWLQSVPVRLKFNRPTSLTQIVKSLAADGINITSDMPLDGYSYAGTVNTTTADAALQQILGAVGLDYQVDQVRHLVTITPMASRTWYINLGDRRSEYQSQALDNVSSGNSGGGQGGQGGRGGQNSGSTGAGGIGSSGGGGGIGGIGAGSGIAGASGGNQGGGSNGNSTNGNGSGGGGNSVTVSDQFWSSLRTELNARLTVLVPRAIADTRRDGAGSSVSVPPIDGMQQTVIQPLGNDAATGGYVPQKVGSYSVNPTTGAITVQAPHWVLTSLNAYFQRVKMMYDTDITFTGELVTLTTSNKHSEGLDIASFGRFASGRFNAIVSNNALGGVTVSLPTTGGSNIPTVTAGSQSIGGALLGIASKADGLQIFNAYLQELGNVSVTQRPIVTTTSGVPGQFSKQDTVYYNLVSQQAASGGVGSAVQATNNTLATQTFGVDLRILPRYDVATGLIRAQINLVDIIRAGSQTIQQTISVGGGSQSIPQTIPLATQLKYSGEALLHDGDLIIVGGQSEDTLQADENGLPGGSHPIGGIFGTANSTRSNGIYYFALRVQVHQR